VLVVGGNVGGVGLNPPVSDAEPKPLPVMYSAGALVRWGASQPTRKVKRLREIIIFIYSVL
jgi:hypothetical protein